eukprot:CAMPEP_0176254026 /NCGR_PEP_ID=MMETSP0121_2-20121125/36322_1 /TAXON_ID=160619 /ORGANISM="Kryptoperidinium foliaceum, Strain CCMP 1326" /LENGTH=84 /DNA_ID=CAMNT_0017593827 /DNA_START=277 /DNA_END=531 /DNA_ORIENTATION=+
MPGDAQKVAQVAHRVPSHIPFKEALRRYTPPRLLKVPIVRLPGIVPDIHAADHVHKPTPATDALTEELPCYPLLRQGRRGLTSA